MPDFPTFMKQPANRIATTSQAIPRGVLHGGEVVAGIRTIHFFGGPRGRRSPPLK